MTRPFHRFDCRILQICFLVLGLLLLVAGNADLKVRALSDSAATGCTLGLDSSRTFGTGSNPFSLTLGDFNGDGRVDLAVANYGSNDVSILLGNHDGTFQPAAMHSVGSNPAHIATADFDGNGTTDLALANEGTNDVSVLLGNGNGTFQSAVNYSGGTNPRSVARGDLNGDQISQLRTTVPAIFRSCLVTATARSSQQSTMALEAILSPQRLRTLITMATWMSQWRTIAQTTYQS